jgi:hypothetical protein
MTSLLMNSFEQNIKMDKAAIKNLRFQILFFTTTEVRNNNMITTSGLAR